jgi:hypothetical protein
VVLMGRKNNRAGCSKGHRPGREIQKAPDRQLDKDSNGNPPPPRQHSRELSILDKDEFLLDMKRRDTAAKAQERPYLVYDPKKHEGA